MKIEDAHIEDIIYKHLAGTATQQEEMRLKDWIEAAPENKRSFVELKKIQFTANVNSGKRFDTQSALSECLQTIETHEPKQRRMYYYISAIAAVAILLMGIWFVYYTKTKNDNKVFAQYTPVEYMAGDSVMTYLTEDSSIVVLNEHTTLVAQNFNSKIRNVKLQGTAYFEVAKDSSRPFVIDVGYGRVTVLGTKFEVRQSVVDSSIIVSVIEGKVRVDDTLHNKSVILVANQRCILSLNNLPEKQTMTNKNFLAWKTRVLEFSNTPLIEAVKEIEQLYGKEIRILSDSLKESLLTARLNNASFEETKSILSLVLSANIEETDSIIIIRD